ncbi:MAG: putative Ig domain-containing protein, partial [Finegoldia magna]|nr:putative Ig domain-containing protein [Finegoldia magna]
PEADITVDGLPNGVTFDKDSKKITGSPKLTDWNYADKNNPEEVRDVKVTVKAKDKAGNESTEEFTITVQRDTDGDGIPDIYDTDDDGDGVTDDKEKEAGTDPKDKNSKPTTSAEEYQAIFNGNAGTPTTQKVIVKDGEVVSGVTKPTREGYKFVKWVKLGTDKEFDLSKPFSKDILGVDRSVIFTAVWEKVVSETGDAAIVYPKETHPIFKKVGDDLTEEEVTNAIVVLGLDRSKYTVTIKEGQELPTTDKAGEAIIDVMITFEDGTTDDAQVLIIITDEEDTTAPTIDAGNITAVEGQPIPPVMVDVDDVNATVTVEGLPEALKYNPETKQIEGTVPKVEDWGDDEEKTITATIKAVDEAGNESTKEITVKILRDTDGDGTPDVTDTDDDNDGVDDKTEEEKGTDPKDKDSKPTEDTTAESIDPTIPEKTGVKDPEKLTDREKEEVKNKIEEANKDKFPEGTDVSVDDKGNATITYPDGSKDTIQAEDLVFKYKHGDPEIDDRPELPISDIIEPTVPGKTDVGDKDNLTDKEKEEIK